MDIILSKNAGFCPGVRRADEAVKNLIEQRNDGDLVFTLGPLIHNGVYVSSLKEEGVYPIEISEVENIIADNPQKNIHLVIRTHGISLEDEAYLNSVSKKHPQLHIVDMTCPSVKKIHKIAINETTENTYFILFGSKTHPESIATISYAKGDKAIISSLEELLELDVKGKMPILCAQTTQNLLQFIQIKNILKKLYTNAIFLIQYVVSLKIVSMRQLTVPKRST